MLRSLACAALLLPATGSVSAQALSGTSISSASLPSAGAVTAFYSKFSAPIWFRGGVASPAAGTLVTILKRAQYDGVASGPQLASEVEGAIARASTRTPADVMAAEQTLSAAWVTYVQAIKRPTPRMIYAYPILMPQNTRPDQILLTAAAAPSLEAHLNAVSNINPIYAQLRQAALQQDQLTSAAPDPRLLANLERARALPAGGRFIIVDSATQRLTMYENGQPVDSMKVIVGMHDLPTPMIASMIHYITYNPYWNVPFHLVRKTIAPNVLKQGLGYLKSHGYEVLADWTENPAVIAPETINWKDAASGKIQIRVRQKPRADNSMGKMKFRFPSGEDIYLHDTPNKALFAKTQRTLSNGCVRLEDAKRLGRWLLGTEPSAPSDDAEIRIPLPQGVPVYLTYLTAQPSSAGVSYLADVYGWDRSVGQQVASGNGQPAPTTK